MATELGDCQHRTNQLVCGMSTYPENGREGGKRSEKECQNKLSGKTAPCPEKPHLSPPQQTGGTAAMYRFQPCLNYTSRR